MAIDPFEAGKAAGQAKLDEERMRNEDYNKRCDAATEKFYSILGPKFLPHGYHFERGYGCLNITPIPYDRESPPFEIKASYVGKGYYVRDQACAPSEYIFEHDCGEARVLELAGNFFGRTIDYHRAEHKRRKESNDLIAQKEKNPRASQRESSSVLLWVSIAVVIIVLLAFAS